MSPGQIVILDGAPRSGKSSIAERILATFEGAAAGGAFHRLALLDRSAG